MRNVMINTLCGLALCASASAHAASNRLALIIGNKDYAEVPLSNPLNDARDMRQKLENLGFTVIYKENASFQAMEQAVAEFADKLRGKEVGLFYYSGHGVQYDNRNYLVPVNNAGLNAADIKYKALDAQRVLDHMESAGTPVNIAILDACRDAPFKSLRLRALGDSKPAEMSLSGLNGSYIAYATAPLSRAADGSGRNGTYTKHLLKHLDTSGINIEEMFKRVRIGVVKETDNTQRPWENSSLTDEFCFVNCQKTDPAELKQMQDMIAKLRGQLEEEANKNLTTTQRFQEQIAKYQQEREEMDRNRTTLTAELTQLKNTDAAQRAKQARFAELRDEEQRLEAEIESLDVTGGKKAQRQAQKLENQLAAVRRELDALGQDPDQLASNRRKEELEQRLAALREREEKLTKLEQDIRNKPQTVAAPSETDEARRLKEQLRLMEEKVKQAEQERQRVVISEPVPAAPAPSAPTRSLRNELPPAM